MTRVLLLGPNGMLGTAIREAAPDDMTVDYPQSNHVLGREELIADRGWVLSTMFHQHPDVIINTIGVRPEQERRPEQMAYVNGTFPHVVIDAAKAEFTGDPIPVIHVSTDCVYGSYSCVKPQPKYSQLDAATPDDLYGRTKLAGESERAINVRTSFVGPRHGLWKWLVDEANKPDPGVDGWANAWWSGSTVNAVAHALLELARHPGEPCTLHLATETPISKAEVIFDILEELVLPRTKVNLVQEPRIDRSLHPDIVLPPFAEALREMVP